jgi:hypothetical protein
MLRKRAYPQIPQNNTDWMVKSRNVPGRHKAKAEVKVEVKIEEENLVILSFVSSSLVGGREL